MAATYQATERLDLYVNGAREGTIPFPYLRGAKPNPLSIGWNVVFFSWVLQSGCQPFRPFGSQSGQAARKSLNPLRIRRSSVYSRNVGMVLIAKILKRLWIWASYVAMVATGFVCFLFFRFPFNFTSVRGRHNIPKRGERVLFVANHTTMYDSFLIGVAAYFPENIFYPSLPFMNFAARENFFRNWFSRSLFTLLRTVPVERRDHPWLMRKYVDFLERNNLLIFYQGTRSADLSVIKNGPGYAIAHTQSPITVIPVYHEGLERIFTRGGPKTRGIWRWLPRSMFRCPTVMFGKPIDFSECFGISETRQRVAAINQRIVASIKSLQSLTQAAG